MGPERCPRHVHGTRAHPSVAPRADVEAQGRCLVQKPNEDGDTAIVGCHVHIWPHRSRSRRCPIRSTPGDRRTRPVPHPVRSGPARRPAAHSWQRRQHCCCPWLVADILSTNCMHVAILSNYTTSCKIRKYILFCISYFRFAAKYIICVTEIMSTYAFMKSESMFICVLLEQKLCSYMHFINFGIWSQLYTYDWH